MGEVGVRLGSNRWTQGIDRAAKMKKLEGQYQPLRNAQEYRFSPCDIYVDRAGSEMAKAQVAVPVAFLGIKKPLMQSGFLTQIWM